MSEERCINCVLCDGSISYPPEMEGREIECPHCLDQIYLLSQDPEMLVSEPENVLEPEVKETVKVAIKKKPRPSQLRLQPIPHIVDPADLVKRRTKYFLCYTQAEDIEVWRNSRGLTGQEIWTTRWVVKQVLQSKQKPWIELFVSIPAKTAPITQFHITSAGKAFKSELTKEELDSTIPAQEKRKLPPPEDVFRFGHDAFRALCAELAKKEATVVQFEGTSFTLGEEFGAEFRTYTLEFFEAVRREFTYFFI